MQKKLPIGVSDFREIIDNNYYYIDKTLLIQEIIASGAKVSLLPRPRRFGKTLNISMLKYFFEKSEEDLAYLFKGLAIDAHSESCQRHQGRYPVIFLTFKDVKESNWENAARLMKKLIADEFKRHDYLLNSWALDEHEKGTFRQITTLEADDIFLSRGFEGPLKIPGKALLNLTGLTPAVTI